MSFFFLLLFVTYIKSLLFLVEVASPTLSLQTLTVSAVNINSGPYLTSTKCFDLPKHKCLVSGTAGVKQMSPCLADVECEPFI